MQKIILSMLIALTTLSTPCSKPKATGEKTVEDYLTAKTWVVKELTYLQYDQLHSYQRGTYSDAFLNDRILFKKGGTGVYTNTYNQPFDISWQFTDEEQSKITLIIKNYAGGGPAEGKTQTIRLENVNVDQNSLKYAEIYTSNGNPTLSSVYRIPF